ncbi:heavy metal translocating P-type ATPase [Campylobacter sp. MIT 12-8780]|uniref:heavy metal translocating P-type ATPase n=1 Tax=unclassified Campylobacter TaxID=2593542 RepID=UPI00115CCF74|nr:MULTISPECIES: heavy metal translocating P-type ATPase [unclassified Campylobacter]NDJ27645.1 heavy metal translocating P-type ATPase [Campylobacter sp. MIT 19-121]TQR40810.1 heavy metal translocating P-type ATPase [Campylobacter sp. MIT 12-8780]
MKCTHCKLEFNKAQMLEKNGHFFCCKGCESVFEILENKGLTSFYEKLGTQSLEPAKLEEISNFDSFVRHNKDGFSEIHLIISKIHCAACIWLNEKILISEEGIIEVQISPLTHKARIVFDEKSISLKQILTLIQSIGYTASAYDPLKAESKAVALKREFYSRLIVAIACVMNIMWISIAKYAGFFSGMDEETKDILNFAEFVLASPVLFYTGSSFYQAAFYALKNKIVTMDLLVISGSSLAYVYSLWAMFSRVGEVYFDSVAMIICFVFVGKYLEVLMKKNASDTMDGLNEFLKAEILVFDGEKFTAKDPYAVQIGDIISLKTGDKIIIDGICTKGEASIDSSSLSGENEPILINKGKELYSACIVIDGSLEYKANKLYKDSKLSQIISLLELSQNKKPKIQSLSEKISMYFSRIMLVLALLCFVLWFFVLQSSFELALVTSISVLIIACPCALALATPISNLIALFKALQFKILFKNSSVIEDLSKCNQVVFDKTGVLTSAKLEVSRFEWNKNLNLNELLSFISLSKHPVSASLAEFLIKKGAKDEHLNFTDFKELRAKGLSANLNGSFLLGGNAYFLKEKGLEVAYNFENSYFIYAKNDEILAFFEFESVLKKGAKELVSYLKDNQIPITMLTGDNEKAAAKIAKELDIKDFKASCLPQTKMQIVQELNKKYKVLMVGDGINDALALKNAAVGISLKQGSDLANETSDIIMLNDDLTSLKNALKLSKKTFVIIKQNLAFSLLYNALTIPLAFLGLINPLIAALSMSASSIVVVLNALRIKGLK